MEYYADLPTNQTWQVLILIIMEDTHGVLQIAPTKKKNHCLNPYYNGRYSWRAKRLHGLLRWSQS